MLKRCPAVLCVVLAVGAAVPAAANDFCFSIEGFSNIYRLRFTPTSGLPARYTVSGAENVFADRALTGSAYFGVNSPNTMRIGFTSLGVTATGGTDIHFNVALDLPGGSGTYAAWRDAIGDRISGAFTSVSCDGVLLAAPAPLARALVSAKDISAGN